jgi:hypothetical protein
MKTVELNIDHTTRPQGLAGELRQHDLRNGDKLTVTTPLDEEMVMLIVMVALIFLHEKKTEYGNKVLNDIFASKGSKEIQNEIEKEYGIYVEVETKERSEDDNWKQFSKKKLSKGYAIDEQEYDLSMVKEPNPTYKK